MNYPWDVLGIEPTDDKKTIKRAYATLLRQHRPDEDPEGFERINAAYQAALVGGAQQSDWMSGINADPPKLDFEVEQQKPSKPQHEDVTEQQSVLDSNLEDIEQQTPTEPPHDEGEGQELASASGHDDMEVQLSKEDRELAEGIMNQFHQSVFDTYANKNSEGHWDFLSAVEDIADMGCRDWVLLALFQKVYEYNAFQHQQNGTLLLTPGMVKSINDVVDWYGQWQMLEANIQDPVFEHVMHMLDVTESTEQNASVLGRALLIFLEFILVVVFLRLFDLDQMLGSLEVTSCVTFVVLNVINTFTICQMGVVQFFAGLRLFDVYMNPASAKQKVIKLVTFHALMLPFYGALIFELGEAVWAWLAILVVWLAYAMVWGWKKCLIQDWVSGTLVLKQ